MGLRRLAPVVLVLIVAGCGGGGGGGGSSSAGGPPSVPTAAAATPPSSLPGPGSSTVAFAIPSSGTRIGTLSWTNVVASGSVQLNTTVSTTPPAATPALQSVRRGVRDVGASALTYVSVVPASSFTVANLPSIAISLAGVSAPLGVAFYDPAAGTYVAVATATPSAGTATFAPPSPARAQNFVAGTTYVFAFYTAQQIGITFAIPTPGASVVPSPVASPSAAPSSTASASPTAVPSVTPAPLPTSCPATNPAGVTIAPATVAIGSVGGRATVTVGGMTPPLTASVAAATLATPSVNGLAVTVTGNDVGASYLQITDANGVTACVPVTVTQLVITGS